MTSRSRPRPTGILNRVDPKTRRIVATVAVGSGSSTIAAGEDSVWVSNQKGNTVVQIDPAGSRIVRTVHIDDSPLWLFPSDGALWVGTGNGNIYRIDPSTGRTARSPERGTLANVGAGGVWVTGDGSPNGRLGKIDAERLRRAGPSLGLNIVPAWVGIAGDQLWVGRLYGFCVRNRGYRGRVPTSLGWSRHDPGTLKPLSLPIHVGEIRGTPVYASGAFWLPEPFTDRLIRIDLTSADAVRPPGGS
jgi:DNA-binding beta-propeller fold protein YncE